MNFRRLLPDVGDGLARLVLSLALLAASMASADAFIPTAHASQSIATAAPDPGPPALLRFVHPQQKLEARTGQNDKIFSPSAAGLNPEDRSLGLPLTGAAVCASAWHSTHGLGVRVTRVRGPPLL